MGDVEKARIFEKMCEAALKENFSRLARNHNPRLILNIWAKATKSCGLRAYFGKWEWWHDKTIDQVLERLDDYFNCLEVLIRKNGAPAPDQRVLKKEIDASPSPSSGPP